MLPGRSQSNGKDGGKGGQNGSTETRRGKTSQKETDEEFTLATDEMKLTDLKDELRKRGTDNKSQLKERLRKAEDAANNKEDNITG